MSEFFNKRLSRLEPYVPGEQPRSIGSTIKLNTNENPYFPSKYAAEKITREQLDLCRLYSDPECRGLCRAVADLYGVGDDNVLTANGSDEILAFAFAAFGEGPDGNGVCFPDVTYGFYKVLADLYGVNYREILLKEDFTVDPDDYGDVRRTVVLANPNAQTGLYLPPSAIEKIVAANPRSVVIIDEAYIDFGGESAVKFIGKYKNLLIVQTFSKSRSLAGARVGFAVGDEALIADLKRIKYSFNPYNVNRISALLAEYAMRDADYFRFCRDKIIASRELLSRQLEDLGFRVLPSLGNFVLAKHCALGGGMLCAELKKRGVLVRHFAGRIEDHLRISIGTPAELDVLGEKLREIMQMVKI